MAFGVGALAIYSINGDNVPHDRRYFTHVKYTRPGSEVSYSNCTEGETLDANQTKSIIVLLGGNGGGNERLCPCG